MADLIQSLASNLSIAGVRSNVTAKTNEDGQSTPVEGAVKADLSAVRSDGKAAATSSETDDSGE